METRRIVGLVLGSMAVLGTVGVFWFVVDNSADILDDSNKVAGILSLLVAVISLFATFGQRGPVSTVTDRVTAARLELTQAVERQWSAAGPVPSHPLELAWAVTEPPTPPRKRGILPLRRNPPRATSGADLDSLITFWRQQSVPQLVITGEPGAGKTVAAVRMLGTILEQSTSTDLESADPVPVLIPLAGWNPRLPLREWLARQIEEQYPVLTRRVFGRRVASELVRRRLILPVFDGLDELPREWQADVVKALTAEYGAARPFVLTCRRTQYEEAVAAAESTLAGARVVELKPLTTEQVVNRLDILPTSGRRRWEPVVTELEQHPTGPLAQALRTPLMVSLALGAYRPPVGGSAGASAATAEPGELCDIQRFPDAGLIREHLLDGFVSTAYRGRPGARTPWSEPAARRWLGFLADQLDGMNRRDVTWWMLPQLTPRPVLGVAVGLVAGLTYFVIMTLGERVGVSAGAGLGPGILIGLLVGWLGVARRTRSGQPGPGLAGGLLGGLVGALVAGLAYKTLGFGNAGSLFGAFPAGLAVGIWVGPVSGFRGGFAGAAVGGFLAGLLVEYWPGLPAGVINGTAVAVAAGLTIDQLGRDRPPAREIDWSAAGLTAGAAVGLSVGLAASWVVGPVLGTVAGMVIGGLVAFAAGVRSGVDASTEAGNSAESLARDRRTFLIALVLTSTASFCAAVLVSGVSSIIRENLDADLGNLLARGWAVGLMTGVGVGLVLTFGTAKWGAFTVARCWLALTGRFPLRVLAFLADARRRDVLRQVGAGYEFRHRELQEHLGRAHRSTRAERSAGPSVPGQSVPGQAAAGPAASGQSTTDQTAAGPATSGPATGRESPSR